MFFLFFSLAFTVCQQEQRVFNKDSVRTIISTQYKGKLQEFQKSTLRKIPTSKQEIYISIDLCDGTSSSFDFVLFRYLEQNNIPAIVFPSLQWINTNPLLFKSLIKNKLLSFQHHGNKHLVPSFQKDKVFGIPCVKTSDELMSELIDPLNVFYRYTGRYPRLYRPPTIYHDSLTITICKALGMQVVGYTGSSYTPIRNEKNNLQTAAQLMKKISDGALFIFHGNHPKWNEIEVLKPLIEEAKKRGYSIGQYCPSPDGVK